MKLSVETMSKIEKANHLRRVAKELETNRQRAWDEAGKITEARDAATSWDEYVALRERTKAAWSFAYSVPASWETRDAWQRASSEAYASIVREVGLEKWDD